jgi:pyruvate/2-oxoglutarate dehydrogenase complex dihydrolipoamide acyltransferase (E2) component
MWWFQSPDISYVSVNGKMDMTAAQAYLARLAEQTGPKVSVQHLLAGVIGRTLHHHPAANARIIHHRIVPVEDVAAAMPVNLLGHAGGSASELGMAVVERLQVRSLREISEATRGAVETEREGKSSNPVMGFLKGLAKRMPQPVLNRALDALDRSLRNPVLADQFYRSLPVTTGLTNPGAALADLPGAKFMGGAFSLPQKLLHVGTLWGVTPISDDVFAIDGKPVVLPALPVLLIFDHRLIDGVAAGHLMQFAFHILQDPERWFGPDGTHQGPGPYRS